MAEVKLYIYKGDKKGDGITFREGVSFIFNKDTILPPQTEKNNDSDETTLITTTIRHTYKIPLLTLTKLLYKKNIYKPCEIHACLQAEVGKMEMKTTTLTKTIILDKNGNEKSVSEKKTEGTFAEINNEMTQRIHDALSTKDGDLIDYFKGANVIMQIDNQTVAENYKVFKVRSLYKTVSNNTSLFLELSIFSADKLMDLDKYSRAYTAKRLFTDILAEESKKFDKVEVANNMQLLKYHVADDKTARDELRIPYIVQYNESFYQFMVRNANRFGEFLYFENGKLNLGMLPSIANYSQQIKKDGKDVTETIDWAKAVQSRYFESSISEGIAVENRAYNFIDHTPENDSAYASSNDSRYNFDPVSTDEWTNQELKHNEYRDFNEILGEEMKAFIPEFVFKALEMSSVGEALVVLIKETLGKIYEVWNQVSDYNNVLDGSNYDLITNNDQKSGSNFSEFATYGGSTNLQNNIKDISTISTISNFTSCFYSTIREKEKYIGEQTVWLNFGDNYHPIKLGDMLNVDGVDYVVTYVEGSYNIVEENSEKKTKEHLLVSAVPVLTLSSLSKTTTSTDVIGQEAWTTTLPFPPALPDVIIRDARPQVAFVVDTLDPQNLGRIRVRYPWQDEKGDPSPWIRVTLPLATAGGAVNFTPSVGDEVMVGYEHGNIDRPYAMGYLTAPFVNERWKNALPLDQYGGIHGIRTKTGHHLIFEDGYAMAPMLANTFGPLSFIKSLWPVGKTGVIDWPFANETTQDFGGGFELSDRYGFYKIKGSTDERSVTIESPAGTVEVNAFQGISINAPNGEVEIKGKNVSIEASNRLKITSGENIKNKIMYQKDFKFLSPSTWGSTASALGIEGVKDLGNSLVDEIWGSFVDMSFVRCVLEYLIRPANGTLQIKSYTFVCIEAGKGATEVPRDSLRYGEGRDVEQLALVDHAKTALTARLIAKNVKNLIETIQPLYDQLCDATAAFNAISGDNGINKNCSVISYKKVIEKGEEIFEENDGNFTWNDLADEPDNGFDSKYPDDKDYRNDGVLRQEEFKAAVENYYTMFNQYQELKLNNSRRKLQRNKLVSICNTLRFAAQLLLTAANKWKLFGNENFDKENHNDDKIDLVSAVAKIKANELEKNDDIITLDNMIGHEYNSDIKKPTSAAWKKQVKRLTRYAVYQYLSDVQNLEQDKGIINNTSDAEDNKKWKKYTSSVKKSNYGLPVRSWFNEHTNPFNGIIDDHYQWTNGVKGKILMSDQENRTAMFSDNLSWEKKYNRKFVEENLSQLREVLKKM